MLGVSHLKQSVVTAHAPLAVAALDIPLFRALSQFYIATSEAIAAEGNQNLGYWPYIHRLVVEPHLSRPYPHVASQGFERILVFGECDKIVGKVDEPDTLAVLLFGLPYHYSHIHIGN